MMRPATSHTAAEVAQGIGGAVAAIRLDHVCKTFGAATAVEELTLDIADGEFFSLIGPSGCGKTTTLRMIAGLEPPSQGRITLHGRDVTDIPAHRRPVSTVFQQYALFPHLDVYENVAFGLRERRVGGREIRRRVGEMLELVGLSERERARPRELSGGQQQRVALARSLVLEPEVLLLDEPLGALDLKLRKQMQLMLKNLQREVGITFLYVTHDQEEAFFMSDRVAIMNHGRLEQAGPPRNVYRCPTTLFVAGFVGTANRLPGVVMGPLAPGRYEVQLTDVGRAHVAGVDGLRAGDDIVAIVRPEAIRPVVEESHELAVTGHIRDVAYLGPQTSYVLQCAHGIELTITVPFGAPTGHHDLGDEAGFSWPAGAAWAIRA
jgi:spermidine/putrescine transport system ATP-binding protein